MQRVDEMTEPPVVGRYYLVRSMAVHGKWWPITGPAHTDPDLGVADVHFHKDVRFLTADLRLSGHSDRDELRFVLGVGFEVVYQRRKCLREQPRFDIWEGSSSTSYARHERRHVSAVARGCKVCPHRGLPLASLPVEADGGVTCPGHGLRWNATTGALMPRLPRRPVRSPLLCHDPVRIPLIGDNPDCVDIASRADARARRQA